MLKKFRNSMLMRRLKILGMIVAIVCAIVAGGLWYQEAPLREAQSLLDRGESGVAIKLITDWEKQHYRTGKSQALLARCLVENGSYAEAIQIFERVGGATPEEMHAWAKAHLSLQQWGEALPLLKALRTRVPDNADVLHELAACQVKLGLREEALSSAEEFARHEEYAHRAWLLIGVIQSELGNEQKAVDAWHRIADYDPEYRDLQLPPEEFLTQFASLNVELGELEEAAQLLARALSIAETAEAHFQAGLVADLQGDNAGAAMHWKRAIELDHDHLNSRESLARIAIASGDGDEAQKLLRPILKADSNRSSTTFLMQRAAYLKGDTEQAEHWRQKTDLLLKQEAIDSTVNQLLKENPNSYWAHVVRAYEFAERGNLSEAHRLLQKFPPAENEEVFVTELRKAVETGGKLPPKYDVPIKLF